jgi:hypothetical protein
MANRIFDEPKYGINYSEPPKKWYSQFRKLRKRIREENMGTPTTPAPTTPPARNGDGDHDGEDDFEGHRPNGHKPDEEA